MFNPAPRVEVARIDARHVAVVLDDVLLDPDALVRRAVEFAADFAEASHNAYPGPELPLPDTVTAQLEACFARHARATLGARRTVRSHARLSITASPPEQLQPRQWLPHVDRMDAGTGQCIAASVLYLFRDPALGGTSFYRPRKPLPDIARLVQDSARLAPAEFSARHGIAPGYPDASDWFEKVATVPARYNRMVVYPGTVFHAGEIRAPWRLVADPASGRLTLNGFFLCRAALAATSQ